MIAHPKLSVLKSSMEILQHFTETKNPTSHFISLEGIEACGKSTHITGLKDYFLKKGFAVTIVREPGGTIFGEQLRQAILSSQFPIPPIAEAYLFASSRAQLLAEKILPLLSQDRQIVICDRFIDSSISYQGVARNLGVATILDIHKYPPLNVLPHFTFYVKINLETSFRRQELRNSKKDYFEAEKVDFYKKIIEGYEQAAQLFPQRIKTIDGEQEVSLVFGQIIKHLQHINWPHKL
ncbi:MAG TPA: dTMP kinase [Bacteriovoracaceae bacterium]|nr:dTMP kinase [Bacteriovoracaceae bacterium]